MVRVSERAHELAERLDPEGRKGRAVEFALELAALIEWQGHESIGEGQETKHARGVLQAFLGSRQNHSLLRLAQGLEAFAMASAKTWPDGSVGLRALAYWLEDPEAGDTAFGGLARGDDMLTILRQVHCPESDE